MFEAAYKKISFNQSIVSAFRWINRCVSNFSWAKYGFALCLLWIVGVSIYDTYLVILCKGHILIDERNPICVMLIKQDPNSLCWFIVGKFLGNAFVITSLAILKCIKYSRTMVIANSVAAFQLVLLLYLTFSDKYTRFLYFDGLFSHNPSHFNEAIGIVTVHVIVLAALIGCGFLARFGLASLRRRRLALDSVR